MGIVTRKHPRLRLTRRGFVSNLYKPHCPDCGGRLYALATVYVRVPVTVELLGVALGLRERPIVAWSDTILDSLAQVRAAATGADDLADDREELHCEKCEYTIPVAELCDAG